MWSRKLCVDGGGLTGKMDKHKLHRIVEDAAEDGLKEVICPAGHSSPLGKSIVCVQSLCVGLFLLRPLQSADLQVAVLSSEIMTVKESADYDCTDHLMMMMALS